MKFKSYILKDRLLRNILFVSSFIILGLLFYNFFFISPSISALVTETTKDDALRTAHYFTAKLMENKDDLLKHRQNDEILNDIQRIKENFELINIKIYSSSGEVLFSGNHEEVGEKNVLPYFHDTVAKGKVYSKIVPKDTESLEGQIVHLDVLEAYVPLMDGDKFLGAFEIYYNITERIRDLHKLLYKSSLILLTFTFLLFSAIFFVLFKEKVAIKERQRLEEERMRKERLQGVLEMAGAACHELNQPLQVISGNCELLLKKFLQNSDVKKRLGNIEESVNRLSETTKKIMNITKYETKDYFEHNKIIDIDRASTETPDKKK